MANKPVEAHAIASGRLREVGQSYKADLDSKENAYEYIAQEMKELQAILTLAENLDPSASAKELTNALTSAQVVNMKVPEVEARLTTAREIRDLAVSRYEHWVQHVLGRKRSIDFLKGEISRLHEQIKWHEKLLAGGKDIPRPKPGILPDAYDELASRGGFYDR